MKHSRIAPPALAHIAATPARADIVCPKGSLRDSDPQPVWSQYRAHNADYLERWHHRASWRRDRENAHFCPG